MRRYFVLITKDGRLAVKYPAQNYLLITAREHFPTFSAELPGAFASLLRGLLLLYTCQKLTEKKIFFSPAACFALSPSGKPEHLANLLVCLPSITSPPPDCIPDVRCNPGRNRRSNPGKGGKDPVKNVSRSQLRR